MVYFFTNEPLSSWNTFFIKIRLALSPQSNFDEKKAQRFIRKEVTSYKIYTLAHYTEVRFASFFSGGFITAIVGNPPERKVAKRTSVHYLDLHFCS